MQLFTRNPPETQVEVQRKKKGGKAGEKEKITPGSKRRSTSS